MKTNIILDVSALFYSWFHMHSKERDDILMALVNKGFMDCINKQARENKSDDVVLAFDGKMNWRKSYTKNAQRKGNDHCETVKKYKGTRRQKLTDSERAKLEKFDEFVIEFREMMKEYTGLLVLQHERLEADDLIAGYVRMHPNEAHIIISQDRDYLQLQRYKNVTQIEPLKNKRLTLLDYDMDADYFMFMKCFRGDSGDNVMSSYPGVRETKIKAAYTDDYACLALMKHRFEMEFIDSVTGELVTKKLQTEKVFEENEMLMDLTKQPEVIQAMIERSIKDSIANRGTYDMIKFLRYCSKMDFQHLIESIQNYNKLLKGPPKNINFD